MISSLYKSLFFSRRFYLLQVGIIVLFVLSYGFTFLFSFALISVAFLAFSLLLDGLFLFSRYSPLAAGREVPDVFSNGDQNPIQLSIVNHYPFPVKIEVLDEIPAQFRDLEIRLYASLAPAGRIELDYQLRPTQRGEFQFHDINVFVKSPMGLVVRRIIIQAAKKVKVMPSFQSLKQFELLAHSNRISEQGNRKIRKLGHSLEFEQIKEYVRGDDLRSINWKATGRKGGQLMVNNYTDERSQQVYCLVDKGRVMKMPFEQLSLLDYAINATLVLSRIALIKQDKAGLITFADQIGTFLPADNKTLQMSNILEALYNQQTRYQESDFAKLFGLVRNRINHRCLIILFTNFESLSAMKRQMPYLRALAKIHLLVVIFFENTELHQLTTIKPRHVEDLYIKTIAEKFAFEKRLMVKEFQQHGISCILTAPRSLTASTVNKYLEIKARQAI